MLVFGPSPTASLGAALVSFLAVALALTPTGPAAHLRTRRTLYGPSCPTGCSACSAVNGCVSCKAPLLLQLHRTGPRQIGLCRSTCPDGFFAGRVGKPYSFCAKCRLEHCEICSGKNVCVRCSRPYVEHRGKCVPPCPALNLVDANVTDGDCVSPPGHHTRRRHYKPGACQVSQWSPWSSCKPLRRPACRGIQTRQREILLATSGSDDVCPPTNQTRPCRLRRRACAENENEVIEAVEPVVDPCEKKKQHETDLIHPKRVRNDDSSGKKKVDRRKERKRRKRRRRKEWKRRERQRMKKMKKACRRDRLRERRRRKNRFNRDGQQ